jgi:hypothetical protein
MNTGRLIGLQLPLDLDKRVREAAESDGRAVADYVRHLLKIHFGMHDDEDQEHLPERERWKRRMLKFAKHVREVEMQREGRMRRRSI